MYIFPSFTLIYQVLFELCLLKRGSDDSDYSFLETNGVVPKCVGPFSTVDLPVMRDAVFDSRPG